MNVRSRLVQIRRSGLCFLHYKVFGRPRPRPFLILTTSRSGSTWLCDLLSKALCIEPVREDFRPQHYQAFLAGELDSRDLLEMAQTCFDTERLVPRAGSKLIWDSIPMLEQRLGEAEKGELLALFRRIQPGLIRLKRQDRVAQAVSRFLATQTRVYHRIRHEGPGMSGDSATPGDHSAASRDAVSYDFDSILRHYRPLVRAESHLDTVLTRAQLPLHTVSYEQLLATPVPVLANALHFLSRQEDALPQQTRLARRTLGSSRLVPTSSAINLTLATRFANDLATRNIEIS